ncbi:oxygen-dependent choline dehydrogenase-like, partial [Convolutriloba macropyga]|uniref:oxygen-dependent choline dehydrogenase-like n=1 Tax=Convolutriloba macropyga TaxID=536237 RepID=UPI003F5242A4
MREDEQVSGPPVHNGSRRKDGQVSGPPVYDGSRRKDEQVSGPPVRYGSRRKDEQVSGPPVHDGSRRKDEQVPGPPVHDGYRRKDEQWSWDDLMQRAKMPLVNSAEECYDYIIVGAGGSGCVVANRLSRTNKTLLIEAGGVDSSWEILMPQHCGLTWGDERFSWPIMTTPQPALKGNKRTNTYLGRVLGGSASINTLGWMRGHQSDYDSWESL